MVKWSYSSLTLFQQCPRKYYRLKVLKDIKQDSNHALLYGKQAHKVAEDYIRDDTAIPPRFGFLTPYLDVLKSMKGDKLCEHEMGLTKELEPCGFKDKEYWWRGIADLIVINDDSAYVVDYKTGKSARYADTKQLEILSIATFKHFPKVKHIKGGLLFVVSKDLINTKYVRSELPKLWAKFNPETKRLEKAFGAGVWNPSPNFTCRNYCPVKDCEHNGRSAYE